LEVIDQTFFRSSSLYVVVVIIGIGQLGAGGEDGLGKVIVLVFILGLLPLNIPDGFYVAIFIVIIDVAKLLLE